jgi:hypothetical protein
MYLANWVHRDVSTGNIILVKNESGKFVGKLSDLEYAKEFRSESVGSRDPKTVRLFIPDTANCPQYFVGQGTPFFMPWEIHANDRLYLPAHGLLPVGKVKVANLPKRTPRPAAQRSSRLAQWPPFYRFDYDLESLWWIFLWIVLSRVLHKPARDLSEVVFTYSTRPNPGRTKIFKDLEDPSILEAMDPKLETLAHPIYTILSLLHSSYREIPDSLDHYLKTLANFWDILQDMASLIDKIGGFELSAPDADILPSQAQEKRQREDESDSAGEEDVGGEGSQKRQRTQLDSAAKNRTSHPGKFTHHIQTSC